MHPPLFQPHPLCRGEVEALVKCHEDFPILKFADWCGESKAALDRCFREEKKLRVKLNPRVSTTLPSALARVVAGKEAERAAAGAGAGAGTAAAH
jgi:hypothetical protein